MPVVSTQSTWGPEIFSSVRNHIRSQFHDNSTNRISSCCHIKKDFWARWWGRWSNWHAFSGGTAVRNNNLLFHNTLGCRSKRLNHFEYIHAFITCPKTTCFPSNHSVLAVQRKNWDPFVLGPAFAMDKTPGPV